VLHYTAIFDGYGFGFEYADPKFVAKRNNLRTFQSHPKWKTKPGTYSDDTQMQVALAELMLRQPLPSTWSLGDIAQSFLSTFRRDPRKGYAGAFYDFLARVQTPAEFLKGIRPYSDKSGAAMRAPVLGLLKEEQGVIDAAYLQGCLTHATRAGLEAAAASALLTHYTYHHIGPKADAGAYIEELIPGWGWADGWVTPIQEKGFQHVRAAIGAIQRYDSASAILKHIVSLTGDVDTSAAIAAPAVFFCSEIENDIPDTLSRCAENGDYGYDYLKNLGEALISKFPSKWTGVGEEDLIGELFGA